MSGVLEIVTVNRVLLDGLAHHNRQVIVVVYKTSTNTLRTVPLRCWSALEGQSVPSICVPVEWTISMKGSGEFKLVQVETSRTSLTLRFLMTRERRRHTADKVLKSDKDCRSDFEEDCGSDFEAWLLAFQSESRFPKSCSLL